MNEETLKHGYEKAVDLIVTKGPEILLALVFLFIGWWAIGQLKKIARKRMHKQEVEPSLIDFLGNMVAIVMRLLLLISVAGMLGIETTSFVAVIGAAGLAIGLALQGSGTGIQRYKVFIVEYILHVHTYAALGQNADAFFFGNTKAVGLFKIHIHLGHRYF